MILNKHGFKYQKKLTHFQLLPLKYILKRAGNYFKFFNFLNSKMQIKLILEFGITSVKIFIYIKMKKIGQS